MEPKASCDILGRPSSLSWFGEALMFRKIVCAGFLIACLDTPVFAQESDQREILSNARDILKTRSGKIRKWSSRIHPSVFFVDPKIKSLFADRYKELKQIFASQESRLSVNPVTENVQYFDLRGYGKLDEYEYEITRDPYISTLSKWRFEKESFETQSNLAVFILPRVEATYIAAVHGSSSKLLSRFSTGGNNCFFSASSINDRIVFGAAFIEAGIRDDQLESCIYEELTQLLGLLSDSPGTKYFTFDDEKGSKGTNYDIQLLMALYDKSIEIGDDPELVLEVFKNYLQNK